MDGLHLTADLHGCADVPALLCSCEGLRGLCLSAVRAAGLQPVAELFHQFAASTGRPAGPAGVTGVVLLAESHLAVHTWPEQAAVTLDVYVCNVGVDNSARAQALLDALVLAFAPASVQRHSLRRGTLPGPRLPA